MTSYIKQTALGPVSSLVSKDKGDFSNRANCAGAQFVNNAKTLAQDVVVLGATAAGAKGIMKGGKFAKFMEKIDSTIMKGLKKVFDKKVPVNLDHKELVQTVDGKIVKAIVNRTYFKKLNPPKWFNRLRQVSASTRCIGLLGMLALPLLGYISGKHIYKSGQIDQKYTDKAKVRQHQSEVL